MKLSYYPGCSMHATGKDFDESLKAVSGPLGIELKELEDWNCCGASATHTADPEVSYNLGLRNLSMAEKIGDDLVTACPACYAHLKHSEHEAKERGGKGSAGNFAGKIRPRHLLDVVHEDIGLDAVRALVKKQLVGIKPVAYYGCLMVRPPELVEMDDPENPVFMDNIMEAIGAEPVEWSYKTDCCGGSLSIPRAEVVIQLVSKIYEAAQEAGANCVVTACPLCHVNMDSRQPQAGELLGKKLDMPVFYFTELMGIAFGLNDYPKWLGRHIVDGMPLVESVLKASAV